MACCRDSARGLLARQRYCVSMSDDPFAFVELRMRVLIRVEALGGNLDRGGLSAW